MRLFLAVFPPPPTQREAFAIEQSLKRPGDRVSCVKLENLHYTLRFLGVVGEDGARRVAEAAREAAAGHRAFTAVLGGLGAFPSPGRARVLWISLVEGSEALVALARALDQALHRRGFGRADHAFSAHLTLGRVRAPKDDWSERLARARTPDAVAARFTVEGVWVVESTLSPRGSIYTMRDEARLPAA